MPRRPWRARAAFIVVSAMLATACSGGSDSLQDAIDDLRSGSDPASGTGARGDDDSGDDPATDPGGPIPALEPDTTPLPIDPAVRIGRLDNGLTYYVRSNDAPGGSLELRLVVNAGSLQEPEPGRGIAHFLEHMLFNGTERFPGNELDRVLRELGTQIGADLNAFTSFDETVYFLSVSTTDPDAVSTAFDVLHEWATAATLVPADVIAERGVVRQELRESIETGDGQIFSQFTDVYTADTAYAGFDPIGTAESVEAMIDTELRDFYDAWYRPENMAVVAVGDLPADELEAAIADRFSTMSARSGPATRTEAQATFDPVPSSYVFTHPDAGAPYLSIDFPVPGWDGSTVGGERLQVMQRLIASMVSGRLRDAHTRGEVASATEPFLEEFSFARELHFLGSNFQGDDLAAALEDYLGILLGVEEAGFDESELARAVDEARAELDFSVDSAGSRQDFEFADSYTSHFLEGAEIDAAGSTADRLRALLDDLTAADVTAHFRWLMRQGGPIVIAVGSDPADVPTVAELDAAIDRARPSLGADTGEGIESLMAPPEPADVITTRTNDDIGSVEWTFAKEIVLL
ncbi:MAG: M16 family metallopeptidase, partial [Acidimicrobiales bacterium]